MILTDIYIPSIDRTMDFSLDENVPVSALVEEIGEMVAQSFQNTETEGMDRLILCDYQSRRILRPDMSLSEQGIRSGSRLFIV